MSEAAPPSTGRGSAYAGYLRWLEARTSERARRRQLEEALLVGQFARYALVRLGPFAAMRGLRVAIQLVEWLFLARTLPIRALAPALLVRHGTSLLVAAWRGALERLREQQAGAAKHEAVRRLERWWQAGLGIAALLLGATALGLAVLSRAASGSLPWPAIAYAVAAVLRAAVELVAAPLVVAGGGWPGARVGALGFVSIDLARLATLVVCGAWIGGAHGPLARYAPTLALLVAALVEAGVVAIACTRALRRARWPRPRMVPALGRFLASLAPTDRRALGWAAGAGLCSRAGAALVLSALVRPVLDEDDLLAVFLLHIIAPLVGGLASWTRPLAGDLRRLASPAASLLRRRADRALIFGTVCATAIAASVLFGGAQALSWPIGPAALPIAVLLLALALFAVAVVRAGAAGAERRLAFVGVALVGLPLAVGLLLPQAPLAQRVELLVAVLAALSLVLSLRLPIGGGRADRRAGVSGLLASLRAHPGPVLVGTMRLVGGRAPLRVAQRLALGLERTTRGPSGCVPAGKRLVWFCGGSVEPALALDTLVRTTGGAITRSEIGSALDGDAGARWLCDRMITATPQAAIDTTAEVVRLDAGRARRSARRLRGLSPSARQALWTQAMRDASRGPTSSNRGGVCLDPAGRIIGLALPVDEQGK